MTILFEERERAAESLFAHEEDVRFRVAARRSKLLGAWMCERLGLTGARAEAYIGRLVADGVGPVPGRGPMRDGDLLDRLRTDLAAGGAADRAGELPGLLARCGARAALEVRTGTP